jgi:hypothetical protein
MMNHRHQSGEKQVGVSASLRFSKRLLFECLRALLSNPINREFSQMDIRGDF